SLLRLKITDDARDITCLAYSPSGDRLAAVGGDGRLRVWDAATGRPEQVIDLGLPPRHFNSPWALVFRPDGRQLVCADPAGLRPWDLATGKAVAPTALAWSERVAFSPDGALCARFAPDRPLVICEAATGRELRRLPTTRATAAAFSRDGRWL